MPVFNNVSGVWKQSLYIYKNVNGLWKMLETIHSNVDGTWKKVYGIPEELIAFSTSTFVDNWKKMDGAEATPTLIDKYPRVAAAQGGTGGSTTHAHAAYIGTTPANNMNSDTDPSDINCYGSHTHTTNHTHPSVNNEPPYITAIPVTNGDKVLTSMFLFYDGSSAPVGWSIYDSAYDKFIKGSATPGSTGGATSHSHSFTGNTNEVNATTYIDNDTAITTSPRVTDTNHSHTINHTHTGGNNYPLWHGLLPVKPDTDVPILPSGICAFFRGSTVPFGWSYFSVAEGKFIQAKSTNGGTGGANTHSHTISINTGYSGYSNAYVAAIADIRQRGVYGYGHLHSYSHTHNTVDNIPPYQDLLFCKKD